MPEQVALSAPIVSSTELRPEGSPAHPYLGVRADRAHAYEGLRRSRSVAWGVTWGLLGLLAILLIGFVRQAGQNRVLPYVVRVDGNGQTVGAELVTAAAAEPDRAMVQHALRLFLLNVRTVTTDAAAQRRLVTDAYAFAGGRATGFLNDWFSQHPPFARASRETVTPRITSFLQLGERDVYEVQWYEERRDLVGSRVERESWRALLTVAVEPPEDLEISLVNPLGIRVVDLDWTQVAEVSSP